VKRVLFVCTGNTCRSPIAAAVLCSEAARVGLDVEVASAGTTARSGGSATYMAIRVASARGLDISGHTAQRISPGLVEWADAVLTMEEGHRDTLAAAHPLAETKVFAICEYAGEGGDVTDPLAIGTLEAYQACADELARLMPRVISRLNQ